MVKIIQSLYPVSVILIAATCAAYNVLTHPRASARPNQRPQNISVYAPTIVVVQTPPHDEFDAHPLK